MTPTRLARGSEPTGFMAQRRAVAAQAQIRRSQTARGPWPGIEPDLPVHLRQPNSFDTMQGLRARSIGNDRGEVLTTDSGYIQFDAGNLPLGDHANTANDIIFIGQLARTNSSGEQTGQFVTTPLAVTAGNGDDAGSCQFWRIQAAGTWLEIDYVTGVANNPAKGDRDAMPDVAYFAAGAPARAAGNIAEPVAIFANNVDEVYVFPSDTNTHTYEELTAEVGLDPFIARSVESFNGKVYFLNTSENNVRYRQRLRRTATFTADPLTTATGAGALDFREFQGDGLRCETLGEVLACYFEDGTAFIRPTGVAIGAGSSRIIDAREILPARRGLLGTHALTPTGEGEHFGIFTDGWWFLNSRGEWREAGIFTDQQGRKLRKWTDTFFTLLDIDKRQRIYTTFDPVSRLVYITFPTKGDTDNETVWLYDIDSDRVFTDLYPVTCWGHINRTDTIALIWSDATDNWSDISGTWASYGAVSGAQALAHGDISGNVFYHDPDLISRQDAGDPPATFNPTYSLQTPLAAPEDLRSLKTGDRLVLEYVNVGGPAATVTASGNSTGGSESGAVSLAAGVLTDVRRVSKWFRLTDTDLQYQVGGTAPVMFRSFEADYFLHPSEPRDS